MKKVWMPLRILGGFGQVQDYTVLVNVADGATMPTDDEIKRVAQECVQLNHMYLLPEDYSVN